MRTLLLLAVLIPAAPCRAQENDVVLRSLVQEQERAYRGLRNAEKAPLYYLGYELRDTQTYDAAATLGALQAESRRHYRHLDVDARLGDRHLDNTHQIKGREAWTELAGQRVTELAVDDDEAALRADIWLRTEDAYEDAFNRLTKVLTNKAVTAEEEDPSDDFSTETATASYDTVEMPEIDAAAWQQRVRRLSAELKRYPFILDSGVYFSMRAENRYLVSSEGTRIVTGNRYVRFGYHLSGRTADGMDLERSSSYDGDSLPDIPPDALILQDMKRSVAELQALLKAPLVEPYSGPAIIRNRAAGVYFHEILGHRLEGHRQKYEEEGQTFTKMLGKQVTAPFLSVYDDPSLPRLGGQFLRGYYRFDDEGVPSRRVALIENGILKSFLMSRMPIQGFAASNGHGRRSAGFEVVPRMANTIVAASQTVPYRELRERLIGEIRRQKKPYGLVFEDIAGGFTGTTRSTPQSFKVLPLLVYRVYPDGRADEAVRGVDIVGTPLTSFGKIIAAADDSQAFNGTCGAESGWVPNAAAAPSLLLSELEVEKKAKSSEKPPLLPSPFHDPGAR